MSKRTLSSALFILSGVFVGLFAAECLAKSKRNQPHRQHYPSASSAARAQRTGHDGWYPRDADKLPIGSRQWWEEMEAEGRAGNTHP